MYVEVPKPDQKFGLWRVFLVRYYLETAFPKKSDWSPLQFQTLEKKSPYFPPLSKIPNMGNLPSLKSPVLSEIYLLVPKPSLYNHAW